MDGVNAKSTPAPIAREPERLFPPAKGVALEQAQPG
jgi:hypothetical protein